MYVCSLIGNGCFVYCQLNNIVAVSSMLKVITQLYSLICMSALMYVIYRVFGLLEL